MPKMKTRKGVAKRFKRTGSGKLKRNSNFKNHILGKKTSKRKRQLKKSKLVSTSDYKRLKSSLPYN
ncbi:50S ribosomal protein L35 [Clostridiaceae bacterium M8S5]|nr:50S ribosomal protein L35 [Clostridiaceae bacterium M8S5]